MTIDLAHPAVSLEMLSRLLDQVTSALMAVDATGRVIVVNTEAQATLNMRADDCVGSRLDDDLERTIEFRAIARVLTACLESPRTIRRQTLTVGTGREARTIGYAVAPLFDQDGAPEGATVVFTDLTEIQARKEKQTETERFAQVGRVASWMAHEVKNPLATIQMYAQLCSRTAGSEQQEPVRVIKEQVTLAQKRISDMLRSLSLQATETRKLAVTDLGPVVCDYLKREAPGLPHITIQSELSPGPHNVPIMSGDALSIIANLITNASEAMDSPGPLTVRLHSEHGTTSLEVEDSGPGFPDEDPQRLLQPFFTTKKRGTGLGLWVVQRIVDSARGRLSLGNNESGGARVTVALPTLGLQDLAGKRVLVVDDDPNLRRILCRQLNLFEAETLEASGALDAADLLDTEDVDVVVTDINMPRGGGYTLLERAPERMPVLLISGVVEAETVAHRRGVAFLIKPFAAEEFGLALSYLMWEASI
ncbi:MAG: ATP-binding protein [Thermoleophilia bacterium]